MTISYNWLSSYLPVSLSPQEISHILTSVGLEVESMEEFTSLKGGLKGLVIGEVMEAGPHPNADKLRLTQVNVGGDQPLRIVCGAPNVAAGQKVVVAPVGATIYPTNGEPVTMKLAKIRGEESQGMICAEDEIGLGESHAGIMVLDESAVPGTPAGDYFGVFSDVQFEIGLTPNRMDAMSHLGVAKDVVAWLHRHRNLEAQVVRPEVNAARGQEQSSIRISLPQPELCSRYAALELKNVQVGPSPQWLQQRLQSIGLKPINNVVDVTNFVLHETGQPLHAFDADRIGGNSIAVKTLPEGSPFTTLDGKERKLQAGDVMICGENDLPLCMAGVFGGQDSGMSESTTRVLLESACFDSAHLRKTMIHHGLRTDAAVRFEKGSDVEGTLYALRRAAQLLQEVAGAVIVGGEQDLYPEPKQPLKIGLTQQYLHKLSGKGYAMAEAADILRTLGFGIDQQTEETLMATVSTAKLDVHLPCDLVEEIIRIDGLDNIDIPTTVRLSPARETLGARESIQERITALLTGLGFSEVLTNSITNSKLLVSGEDNAVKLLNSLSSELDVLRTDLIQTALPVIAHNLNRKQNGLRFFEYGKVYRQQEVGKYEEVSRLAIYCSGATIATWQQPATKPSLYYLKGLTTAIANRLGLRNWRLEAQPDGSVSFVARNQSIGRLYEVSTAQLNTEGIKQPVLVMDLNFDQLVTFAGQPALKFTELPKYPTVSRDLAVVVPANVTYQEVETVVRTARLSKLQQLRLFDVYKGENLGAGKQSMALNFSFADAAKTLTDTEVETMMNTLIHRFEQQLGAVIRK